MTVTRRSWIDVEGKTHERWQISIAGFKHPDGRIEPRIRVPSPVNTRKAAEDHERAIRASLAEGNYGKAAAAEIPTLKQFVETFLIEASNNNKSSTVNTKRTLIELHLEPYFGKLRLDEIGSDVVERFKAQLRTTKSQTHVRKENASAGAKARRYGAGGKTLSDKTINNVLTVLKRMLALALERKVITHASRIKLFRTARPDFDFLDFDEADRVIASADPAWRPLILTAIKTGLRTGELIGLQWADVDTARLVVHVRRTISKGVEGTPKGGRSRTVEIPGSVAQALKASRHMLGAFVFCQPDGQRLTEGQMKHPLRRAVRLASIARVSGVIGWHDLRHTYGSHLAMRGVPLRAIQDLMGHATIEMTMRYAHLSPGMKAHAVAALDAPAPEGVSR